MEQETKIKSRAPKRYKAVLSLLLNYECPDDIIIKYLEGNHLPLQDFCASHTKLPWCYGISIIDALDILVENKE